MNNRITGDLATLPRSAEWIDFYSNFNIGGRLEDTPPHAIHLDVASSELITGNFADLPRQLEYADISANWRVHGKVKNVPKGMYAFGYCKRMFHHTEIESISKDILKCTQ